MDSQQETPLPHSLATKRTYNALRRFLPTGADVLDFDGTMAARIGNWQELGGGNKRKRTVQLPMSKRYADDRVCTAAGHKRWIVAAVVETLRNNPGRHDLQWTYLPQMLRTDVAHGNRVEAGVWLPPTPCCTTSPRTYAKITILARPRGSQLLPNIVR